MSEKEIKELTHRRGQIKGTVSRIQTFVDNFKASDNVHLLKTRLPNLRNAFNQFEEVQSKLELILPETAALEQEVERDDFENKYYQLEATMASLLEKAQSTTSSTSESASDSNKSETRINPVKLPTLDLPIFSGIYLEWISFADRFNSLIHSSNLYIEVEKFHYLK